MAKITRSTVAASTRRREATWAIALAMPRRRHSWSATQEDPIERLSSTFSSGETVAATASAGSRKRLIDRTRRLSASLSTRSARPKLWTIWALGTPVCSSRTLWASAR